MNLTASMAKNPGAFLDAARKDAHARHAAILACDSREDFYREARALGLSDQEIIANRNAELHEDFDDEAGRHGKCEIDPEIARRLSTENIRFGNVQETMAIIALMEESDCE